MALAFDEFGRPFIILKEQKQKMRLRGLDAQKANVSAGKTVARILRTSLGPKGMATGVGELSLPRFGSALPTYGDLVGRRL